MSALVRLHMEALTDECTCPRLSGCGGIQDIDWECPEHSLSLKHPEGRFHTHPMQVPGRINRGLHIA